MKILNKYKSFFGVPRMLCECGCGKQFTIEQDSDQDKCHDCEHKEAKVRYRKALDPNDEYNYDNKNSHE